MAKNVDRASGHAVAPAATAAANRPAKPAATTTVPSATVPSAVPAFPAATVVFFVSLAAYLIFLPASVYWLDSPEFMAAGANLGLAHPPGHPVMAMLLKLFMLLPIGDVPFRANLLSACFGAMAAAFTAGISQVAASGFMRRLSGGEVMPDRARVVAPAVGILSGLMFAGCRSAFIQSMACEVYTLNAALLLGAVFILVGGGRPGEPRPAEPRRGMAAGALLGLALANHHLLAILAIPALIAAFWTGRRGLRVLGLVCIAAAVTCAAAYLYLPVRSLADAWPTWSTVSSPAEFLWYVSARIFSASVGGFEQTGGGPVENMGLAFVLVAGSLGPLTPVFAAGGAWLMFRSGERRAVAVLVLLLAGGACSKVMMGILDPSNPDDHGYFMLALSATAILAMQLAVPVLSSGGVAGKSGEAGKSVARRAPSVLRGAVIALFVAAAVFPWVAGVEVGATRSRFDDARKVAGFVWDDVPQGAVAFVSHYPVYFMLQYQQQVEGARPDVTLVQESLYYKARGGRWYAGAMSRRDPALAGMMSSFNDSGRLSWPEFVRLASVRPVVFESSPDFEAPPGDVRFNGWFFRVAGTSDAAAARDPSPWADAVRRTFAGRAASSVETRRVVIRNLASSAEWMMRAGDNAGAATLIRGALEFNPDDRTLKAMLASVGDRVAKPVPGP